MSDAMVEQVRHFTRVVTERVGPSTIISLGEARLLWGVGLDGCEVRLLRARLGLGCGYLSQPLRSLQRAGLVTVAAGSGNRRVRVALLTAAGRRERAALDKRSDDLAQSLLAPLVRPSASSWSLRCMTSSVS